MEVLVYKIKRDGFHFVERPFAHRSKMNKASFWKC